MLTFKAGSVRVSRAGQGIHTLQCAEWRSVIMTGKDGGHAADSVKPGNAYGPPPSNSRPLSHIEYREKLAQGRTHLRKRDYESELLERLLSRGPRGASVLLAHFCDVL